MGWWDDAPERTRRAESWGSGRGEREGHLGASENSRHLWVTEGASGVRKEGGVGQHEARAGPTLGCLASLRLRSWAMRSS